MLPIPMTPEVIALMAQTMALNKAQEAAAATMPSVFPGLAAAPSPFNLGMPSMLPFMMAAAGSNMTPQQAMLMQACYQQAFMMSQFATAAAVSPPQLPTPPVKSVSLPQSPCPVSTPPPAADSPSARISQKRKSADDGASEPQPAKKGKSQTPPADPLPALDKATSSSTINHSPSSDSDSEDAFIDVVGCHVRKSKEQRKSQILFFRQVKTVVSREKTEKNITCQLCKESAFNNENFIKNHLMKHAKVSCMACKLCGQTYKDTTEMYTHMNDRHPRNLSQQFEDKRDMVELLELLPKCFPRVPPPKGPPAHTELVNRLIENLPSETKEIECSICEAPVPPTLETISKHITLHHPFRCKICKHIEHTAEAIQEHVKTEHNEDDPKPSTHFNVSAASEAIVTVIKRCFGKHLPGDA